MKLCSKLLSALLAVCILCSIATPALAGNLNPISDWATEEVQDAVVRRGLVPLELQRYYQRDITRGEFAKMAIYFLSVQYDYPTFWADGVSDDAATKDFICYFLEESLNPNQEEDLPRYQIDTFLSDVPEEQREAVEQGGWRELLEAMTPFAESNDPTKADDFFFIHAAYVLGIVKGRDDGTFGPNDPIARQEAAAMLTRTCQLYNSEAVELETVKIHTKYTDADQIGSWAKSFVDIMTYYKVMNGTGEGAFSPLSHYTREQCIVTFDRLQGNTPVDWGNYGHSYVTDIDRKLSSIYHGNIDVWDRWDTDDAVVIVGRSGMAPIAAFHGTYIAPKLYILYRSDDKKDVTITAYSCSMSEDDQYVSYTNENSQKCRIYIRTGKIEEIQ